MPHWKGDATLRSMVSAAIQLLKPHGSDWNHLEAVLKTSLKESLELAQHSLGSIQPKQDACIPFLLYHKVVSAGKFHLHQDVRLGTSLVHADSHSKELPTQHPMLAIL